MHSYLDSSKNPNLETSSKSGTKIIIWMISYHLTSFAHVPFQHRQQPRTNKTKKFKQHIRTTRNNEPTQTYNFEYFMIILQTAN